jgi:transposase InsO family protein
MTYHIRNKYGLIYNHKRVYRLMCIHNIVSSYRRRSSYHYRRSTPETTAENLLNRDFNADHINEKWCTDITEIKVPGTTDKLYISPVLDLCDRYPVALRTVSGTAKRDHLCIISSCKDQRRNDRSNL